MLSSKVFFSFIYFDFILQPGDLIRWKQVAARFSELITEAAVQLRRDEQHSIHTETINSTTSYINVRIYLLEKRLKIINFLSLI